MSDKMDCGSVALASGATLRQALDYAIATFTSQDIENARQEAKWLLAHCLECRPAELISLHNVILDDDTLKRIESYMQMRCQGIPLSRVLGVQEFWGLPMRLNAHTLDPRQDTEMIPECVLKKLPKSFDGCCLDLGTGSGCIPITLLHEYNNMTAVAVDVSFEAISQATDNAIVNNVGDRFFPVCGSWAESLSGTFPLIVSNPPYIASEEIKNLHQNVKNHDPILALDGGPDGFQSLKQIISALKKHLSKDGYAFIEIGINQVEEMERLIEESGLPRPDVHLDSAGIPRVVEISYGDK